MKAITNNDSASGAVPNVARNEPFLFATYPLCAMRGKPSPTAVTLTKPTGGLQVVDWGVNFQDSGVGAGAGTVSSLGGYTHGPVTASCAATSQGQMLDVSVKSSADVASSASFVVHYKYGQVVVPFAVMICTATCPKQTTTGKI